jgi:hypothetical protein
MLHIHNGDCSAEIGRRTRLPGEHQAWREALSHGPAPAGLPLDEWLSLRARHLAGAYDATVADCAEQLDAQEAWLSRAGEHDEVVVWVEYDLFCQVTLLYLLHAFERRVAPPERLSLVCPSAFPGIDDFRGLGQLDPDQLASLFDGRMALGDRDLATAGRAWRAYGSADPRAIDALLAEPSDAGPFVALGPALAAHLRRFPSTRDGLGAIERRAVSLLEHGPMSFEDLFHAFGAAERVYGLGDAQFLDDIRRLAWAPVPFVIEHGQTSGSRPATVYELTDAGRAACRGEADFVELNGIDLWLGGVHLHAGAPLYRFDGEAGWTVQALQ